PPEDDGDSHRHEEEVLEREQDGAVRPEDQMEGAEAAVGAVGLDPAGGGSPLDVADAEVRHEDPEDRGADEDPARAEPVEGVLAGGEPGLHIPNGAAERLPGGGQRAHRARSWAWA